jgi:predicted porin
LTIDLEYLANSDKAVTTTTAEAKTNSTIIEARYNINGWVPNLKYEMSENKSAAGNTAQDFKREAYAVGVEYVPKADEAFRYHVAYSSAKDKDFGTGSGDSTKNMIVVGFKYTGDMAK